MPVGPACSAVIGVGPIDVVVDRVDVPGRVLAVMPAANGGSDLRGECLVGDAQVLHPAALVTVVAQTDDDAARIPVSSPGWGLLTTDHGPSGIRVYDLAPERIPDFLCPILRVP